MSTLEEEFNLQLRAVSVPPYKREFRFHPSRRWRADFAWPLNRLLVEIEGGLYTRGRHQSIKGFQADCEKYNTAVLEGYTVMRFTSQDVKNGNALKMVERFLEERFNE